MSGQVLHYRYNLEINPAQMFILFPSHYNICEQKGTYLAARALIGSCA